MRYIVAANYRMYKEYVRLFADRADTCRFISRDMDLRGLPQFSTIVLFENYRQAFGWSDISEQLQAFSNVFEVIRQAIKEV